MSEDVQSLISFFFKWPTVIASLCLITGLLLSIIALWLVLKIDLQPEEEITFETNEENLQTSNGFITVDIAGAVNQPGVYLLASPARMADAIAKAGGLHKQVDPSFFSQQLNLAQKLEDEKKIYIPFKGELDQHAKSDISGSQSGQPGKISINTATVEELDTLPGIGEKTAENIVNNRPYEAIDELMTKAKVGKNVFEQIKEQVRE